VISCILLVAVCISGVHVHVEVVVRVDCVVLRVTHALAICDMCEIKAKDYTLTESLRNCHCAPSYTYYTTTAPITTAAGAVTAGQSDRYDITVI
jgi:hypothetical protein